MYSQVWPEVCFARQVRDFRGVHRNKADVFAKGSLGRPLGSLGRLLGGFWGPLGGLLGPLRVLWRCLGDPWGCHDASWGSPGVVWGCLGSLLGCVWEGFPEILRKVMENLRKGTGSIENPKKFTGKPIENIGNQRKTIGQSLENSMGNHCQRTSQ